MTTNTESQPKKMNLKELQHDGRDLDLYEFNGESARWASETLAVPTIGTWVNVTMNELGYGTVSGYEVIEGWLFIKVKLDFAPSWKPALKVASVTGVEFRMVNDAWNRDLNKTAKDTINVSKKHTSGLWVVIYTYTGCPVIFTINGKFENSSEDEADKFSSASEAQNKALSVFDKSEFTLHQLPRPLIDILKSFVAWSENDGMVGESAHSKLLDEARKAIANCK